MNYKKKQRQFWVSWYMDNSREACLKSDAEKLSDRRGGKIAKMGREEEGVVCTVNAK